MTLATDLDRLKAYFLRAPKLTVDDVLPSAQKMANRTRETVSIYRVSGGYTVTTEDRGGKWVRPVATVAPQEVVKKA